MSSLVLAGRVVLSLACVLGLIWYAQRRFAGPLGRRRPAGPQLSVVGRHTLGRHASVAVLAAGDRRLLIGVTEHGITLLTELDPVVEPAADLPSPYEVASTAATAAALSATSAVPTSAVRTSTVPTSAAPTSAVPTSAAARLLARLPVQREEIDLGSLDLGTRDRGTADRGSEDRGSADVVRIAVGQTGGPLDGSILSPSTWRRAARAVRR
ncbi:flagellar biosynthesis protein, FliO [mine drainage metagenome]|uniref:Flagellar biosynthesis protein, FliO n=1 Tax=mine drainage metagenome TaxID=410659 RepID=A0A1J5QHN3_9ZZZZ